MDSSAVITQLPPTAYRALRRAFRNAMRAYPRSGATGTLDTCYDFLGLTNVRVPAVSLVFGGGAVVVLDPPAVMLGGCLAFTATSSDLALGFIGNVQQQTHEVLYDVAAGGVGFRRGAC
ncbi:Aspartic proteinase nepenthesin-2 [Triticum urartu]|nr:Aspartic proteinase nepenthesin-2 [Triticum urartu]